MAEVSTVNPQFTLTFVKAMLAPLTTGGSPALLAGTTLRLYSSRSGPINQGMDVSIFTEATFTGYAGITPIITSALTVNNPSGDGAATFNAFTFLCTSGATPETIQGYYVTDSGGAVIMAEDFPTPISVVAPGDFIAIDLAFPLSGTPHFL